MDRITEFLQIGDNNMTTGSRSSLKVTPSVARVANTHACSQRCEQFERGGTHHTYLPAPIPPRFFSAFSNYHSDIPPPQDHTPGFRISLVADEVHSQFFVTSITEPSSG